MKIGRYKGENNGFIKIFKLPIGEHIVLSSYSILPYNKLLRRQLTTKKTSRFANRRDYSKVVSSQRLQNAKIA